MQTEVLQQEQALKSLTRAVEFDHETLDSVVNQLQVDQNLVLAPNVSSVPTFYKYMKAKTTHSDFDPNKNVRKFQRFYTNHISELSIDEAKAFETNVLQLQNNRLPLDKNFLIALRAKCLAVQTVHAPVAQMFCNDLAFHATRWDTGLKFHGVGFEFDVVGLLLCLLLCLHVHLLTEDSQEKSLRNNGQEEVLCSSQALKTQSCCLLCLF